jgi:putrescine aminotransferase
MMSTFGGNPAACAAALKTIEIMRRDDIPGRAATLGEHAKKRLEEFLRDAKTVKEVRGKGLFLGVELDPPRMPGANMDENYPAMVISRLLSKHGVLTSYYDLDTRVIRFEPPLIVTREQVDQAVDAFGESLKKGTAGLTLSFGGSVMKRAISRP